MGIVALIEVGEAVADAIAGLSPGIEAIQGEVSPALDGELRSRMTELEAVVIGHAVPDPINLAQRMFEIDPTLSVVILGDERHRDEIRTALRFASRLESNVRYETASIESTPARVFEAAKRTRARRLHFGTLEALNAEISSPERSEMPSRDELVEHLIELAPIGMLAIDRRAEVRSANGEAARILRTSEPELVGRNVAELWGQRVEWDRLLELAQAQPTTQVIPDARGERALEVRAARLSQHPGGFVLVVQDLAGGERVVRAEENLRRSEERARVLIDAVKDYAIFTLDRSGVVTSWNTGAQRLKGFRAEEIIGRHFSRFYPEVDVRAGKCEMELEVAVREGRLEDEGWRVRADGSQFFANVIITPIYDVDGSHIGFAKVSRDLTESRRNDAHRAELAAENAALVERARTQEFHERFLAILGHDLRNPLAAIEMGLGLLRQSSTRETNIVGRMSSSARRMSRMIEQILDLTRSRLAEGLEVKPEEFDLSASLGQIVEEMRIAYPTRSLVCKSPPFIAGSWDRDRLEQVFSNLIGNALDYGSNEGTVTVEAVLEGSTVTITVHNLGPPIPEELCVKLFDPFRRGDRDSRTSRTSGLGLGLYISHEIVAGHGGSIEVRSTAEEGTTFKVTLPLTAASRRSSKGAGGR